eukprot:jgi/Mesvir1/2216/Mv04551-RA.1
MSPNDRRADAVMALLTTTPSREYEPAGIVKVKSLVRDGHCARAATVASVLRCTNMFTEEGAALGAILADVYVRHLVVGGLSDDLTADDDARFSHSIATSVQPLNVVDVGGGELGGRQERIDQAQADVDGVVATGLPSRRESV